MNSRSSLNPPGFHEAKPSYLGYWLHISLTYIKIHFSVSSLSQSLSQADVCVSTPRMGVPTKRMPLSIHYSAKSLSDKKFYISYISSSNILFASSTLIFKWKLELCTFEVSARDMPKRISEKLQYIVCIIRIENFQYGQIKILWFMHQSVWLLECRVTEKIGLGYFDWSLFY